MVRRDSEKRGAHISGIVALLLQRFRDGFGFGRELNVSILQKTTLCHGATPFEKKVRENKVGCLQQLRYCGFETFPKRLMGILLSQFRVATTACLGQHHTKELPIRCHLTPASSSQVSSVKISTKKRTQQPTY
jgi:hypothetical protein